MASCQIKQNPEDDTTELWIRGQFIAGWRTIELSDQARGIVEAMMREVWDQAVKSGEAPLRQEMKRALQR